MMMRRAPTLVLGLSCLAGTFAVCRARATLGAQDTARGLVLRMTEVAPPRGDR